MKTLLWVGTSIEVSLDILLRFRKEGWNVVAAIDSPSGTMEAHHLDRVLITHLDVADPDSVRVTMAAAEQRFGNVDVLVNDVGRLDLLPTDLTPNEKIEKTFKQNIFGPALMTRAVMPNMIKNQRGVIVNIVPSAALTSEPPSNLDRMSKSALDSLSHSLAYELSDQGIRVHTLVAGPEAYRPSGLETVSSVSNVLYQAVTEPDMPVRVVVGANAESLQRFLDVDEPTRVSRAAVDWLASCGQPTRGW